MHFSPRGILEQLCEPFIKLFFKKLDTVSLNLDRAKYPFIQTSNKWLWNNAELIQFPVSGSDERLLNFLCEHFAVVFIGETDVKTLWL